MKRFTLLVALALLAAACGGDDTGGAAGDAGSVAATTTTTAASTTAPETGGESIVAQEGDVVAVHYVGTLDDGSEFDSSRTRDATLDFQIGSGNMIAGFDQGVRGMAEGEIKTIRIEPADAYGEYSEDLLVEVDISQVPDGVVAGDVLVDPSSGAPVPVVSVEGNVVTLDLNHQLAGEVLTFEIEMVAITR